MSHGRRLRQLSKDLRPSYASTAALPLVQDMFGPLDIPHKNNQRDLLPIRFQSATAPWQPGGLLPAGMMQQRIATYYSDTRAAVSAGLWEVRGAVMDVPIPASDKCLFLMLLPESVGSVSISCNVTGEVVEPTAEQAIIIPEGAQYTWRQPAGAIVVAAFESFSSTVVSTSAQPPASEFSVNTPIALIVVDGDEEASLVDTTMSDTSRYIGTIPTQHLKHLYTDQSGQMTSVLWDTTAMHTRPLPHAGNPPCPNGQIEFAYLVEGGCTIRNGDGIDSTFTAGEGYLVPRGMTCVLSPVLWLVRQLRLNPAFRQAVVLLNFQGGTDTSGTPTNSPEKLRVIFVQPGQCVKVASLCQPIVSSSLDCFVQLHVSSLWNLCTGVYCECST